MVCFKKIAGASVAFATLAQAMPSEMATEVAEIDADRVDVVLAPAETVEVQETAEVVEAEVAEASEASEESEVTEEDSETPTAPVEEVVFSRDLPVSSISTDQVLYKKLRKYYDTYYEANEACRKFHPSARLAEAHSLNEWAALNQANQDDTNRIGPKKTGAWISNGMVVDNGHGNQRLWSSGFSISTVMAEEQARSNIPCAYLNVKNGYSVVNCGQIKKNTGAICEIRSGSFTTDFAAQIDENFSVPATGCDAWADNSDFTRVDGQEESSNCVFYKATSGVSSNYFHASQACKLLHPDAEPAEARNQNEFDAMLAARIPDSKYNYWLGRGMETVQPKATRTFKSGREVNVDFFKTRNLILNTDLTEYPCMRLGNSVAEKPRNFIETHSCDLNDSNQMTMCELRN